jgi:hypothetical protein
LEEVKNMAITGGGGCGCGDHEVLKAIQGVATVGEGLVARMKMSLMLFDACNGSGVPGIVTETRIR